MEKKPPGRDISLTLQEIYEKNRGLADQIDTPTRDHLYNLSPNTDTAIRYLMDLLKCPQHLAKSVLSQVLLPEIPLEVVLLTKPLMSSGKVPSRKKLLEILDKKGGKLSYRPYRILRQGKCLERYKEKWPEIADQDSVVMVRPAALKAVGIKLRIESESKLLSEKSEVVEFVVYPGDLGTRIHFLHDPEDGVVLNRNVESRRLKKLDACFHDVVPYGDMIELIAVKLPSGETIYYCNDGQARITLVNNKHHAYKFIALIHEAEAMGDDWTLIHKRVIASKYQNPVTSSDVVNAILPQSLWYTRFLEMWRGKVKNGCFEFKYIIRTGPLVEPRHLFAAILNYRLFLELGKFPETRGQEFSHLNSDQIVSELLCREVLLEEIDFFFGALVRYLKMTSLEPRRRHHILCKYRFLTMFFLFYRKYQGLPKKDLDTALRSWSANYGRGQKNFTELKEIQSSAGEKDRSFCAFARCWLKQVNLNRKREPYQILGVGGE
jgi:hypothetical protein